MEGQEEVLVAVVKDTVDGSRMGLEGETGSSGLGAGRVLAVVVELLANGILLVGDDAGLPDSEAGWVAKPGGLGLGNVAKVVEFLSWVVDVDVLAAALEVVTAVLGAPKPLFCVSIFILKA